MKKLKISLIILIGLFPLICNAQVEKEVKYKWYTLTEENIHYENEVENNCEYFDLSDTKIGNWIYSLEKPEEKSYRRVEEELEEIKIERNYFNVLKLDNFEINQNIEMYELEIMNINNENLDFELLNVTESRQKVLDKDLTTSSKLESFNNFDLKFKDTQDVKKLKIRITYKDDGIYFRSINFRILLNEEIVSNSFGSETFNIETECHDGICIKEFTLKDEIYEEPITIKTKVYKYQDKSYKCYTPKKIYVPEYHEHLEGFIKDEENFIEVVKETKEDLPNKTIETNEKSSVDNIDNVEITYQELNKEEIAEENNKEEPPYSQLAMVNKENKSEKEESIIPYILLLIALFIFSIIALITKKVVNSRTK